MAAEAEAAREARAKVRNNFSLENKAVSLILEVCYIFLGYVTEF